MYEQFLVFTYILGALILEQVSVRQIKKNILPSIRILISIKYYYKVLNSSRDRIKELAFSAVTDYGHHNVNYLYLFSAVPRGVTVF